MLHPLEERALTFSCTTCWAKEGQWCYIAAHDANGYGTRAPHLHAPRIKAAKAQLLRQS